MTKQKTSIGTESDDVRIASIESRIDAIRTSARIRKPRSTKRKATSTKRGARTTKAKATEGPRLIERIAAVIWYAVSRIVLYGVFVFLVLMWAATR